MRFWQQHYYNNYQFSSESSGGNNNNNININDNINITSINTHNHHGLEILNNTTLNFARPQSPAHTASITATQKKLRELPRIITNFPKRKSCQQQPQPQPQQNEIKTSISNNNNNNNNNKKKSSNVQQSVKFALDPSHSRKHQKSESDHNIITNGSKKNGNVNDNRYRVLRRSSAPVTGLSYNNNNKPPVSRIDLLTGRQMGRESEENSTIPMVIVDNHGHVNDKHNDSESSLFSSPPQQSRNNDYENNFNNINNINSSNFSSSISSSLTSNTCSLSPFIPPSLTPSSSVSSLNSSVGQLSPFFTSNNNKDTNNSDNNDNNNDRGRILLNTMSTTLPSQSQRPPPPSSSLTAPLQPPSSNNFNTRPKSKSISTEHPFAIESFISPVTPASYGDLPWSPAVSFLSSLASATANTPLPDDEGQQVGDYVLGKVIGRGGFSTVREGYTIDDSCTMEKVAVKIVKNDQNCEENDRVQSLLEREIAIWRELDHPNILPMFSVEETEYATFIFSEFCPGGTLLNYIKNNSSQSGKGLSEEESHRIFLEMAEALRYLHNDMRLVHKDVKLDNILLDKDGDWKLCDFGLTEFQNPEVNGFANLDEPAGGSLAYSSPEQLRSKTSIRNPAVDIWSLGVVLFAMVTGQLPFTDGYEPRLQYNIINGRYDESILCKAGASEELCDLLKGMFKTKPEQRLTINQVLEHPWCQP